MSLSPREQEGKKRHLKEISYGGEDGRIHGKLMNEKQFKTKLIKKFGKTFLLKYIAKMSKPKLD